jgi:hypothetical protein
MKVSSHNEIIGCKRKIISIVHEFKFVATGKTFNAVMQLIMQIIRHCFLLGHEGRVNARLFITDHTKTGIPGNAKLPVRLKKLKLYAVA